MIERDFCLVAASESRRYLARLIRGFPAQFA